MMIFGGLPCFLPPISSPSHSVISPPSPAGTPEYLAPEVLNRSGHGRAVDWWSLGALLYEMLTGLPPFYSRDRNLLFDKIRKGDLDYPPYLSPEAVDILKKLLTRDPTRRLGCGPGDALELKNHPYFKAIDWTALREGRIPAPWVPLVTGSMDTSQFDAEFTNMPIVSPSSQREPHVGSQAAKLFSGFTYVAPHNMGGAGGILASGSAASGAGASDGGAAAHAAAAHAHYAAAGQVAHQADAQALAHAQALYQLQLQQQQQAAFEYAQQQQQAWNLQQQQQQAAAQYQQQQQPAMVGVAQGYGAGPAPLPKQSMDMPMSVT